MMDFEPGQPKLVAFEALEIGKKFITFPSKGEANIWIKISNNYLPEDYNSCLMGNDFDNAICFHSGFAASFNKNSEVVPVRENHYFLK